MVDGSSIGKLFKVKALLKFLTVLPGADIVHLNMAADASCFRKLIFLNIASAFRKKIVVHHHGGDFEGFYEERCSAKKCGKSVRRSLNKADLFLVLSENWKLFFENIVSPDKIFVLENCIPIPEKAKQDHSGHQAVFLGRLCKEKGIGELLESAKRVRKVKSWILSWYLAVSGKRE